MSRYGPARPGPGVQAATRARHREANSWTVGRLNRLQGESVSGSRSVWSALSPSVSVGVRGVAAEADFRFIIIVVVGEGAIAVDNTIRRLAVIKRGHYT